MEIIEAREKISTKLNQWLDGNKGVDILALKYSLTTSENQAGEPYYVSGVLILFRDSEELEKL